MKSGGYGIVLILICMLALAMVPVGNAQDCIASSNYIRYQQHYEQHAPISIDGDLDFATQALLNGWHGQGTETDPYIIEGYEINLSSYYSPGWGIFADGIRIRNTDAHFIMRNCCIHGRPGPEQTNYTGTPMSYGIHFDDVTNGAVEGCIISDTRNQGALVEGGSNITIRNSRFINNSDGFFGSIVIYRSTNISFKSNFLEKNNGFSIEFQESRECVVENNTMFKGTNDGVLLFCSSNISVTGNTISEHGGTGIALSSSSNNKIVGNTIFNNNYGILVYRYHDIDGEDYGFSDDNVIVGNTVHGNSGGGICCYVAANTTISENTVSNNNYTGIHIAICEKAEISGNHIVSNNGDGLHIAGSYITIKRNKVVNNSYAGIRILDHSGILTTDDGFVYDYCSTDGNIIHDNYFENERNFLISNEGVLKEVFWNLTPTPGKNIIGGNIIAGNYWSDYKGADKNGDGIGDTDLPYGPGDYAPLVKPGKVKQHS